MLKKEREQEILNLLRDSGYITVKQMCAALYASESTVRRILSELEKKGLVRRSYGGAELLESRSHVVAFRARANHNREAKREIGRKAAALVPDGSLIFLDQSSTSFYLACELMDKKGLTVVTNNVEIVTVLAGTDFGVYSSGGRLSEENRMCLVGADAQKTFADINADFAFFSAKALSADGVISDCTREEVYVRISMLKNAKKKVFLCDSEKFDTDSAFRQCTLNDVDMLISEGDHAQRFAGISGLNTL